MSLHFLLFIIITVILVCLDVSLGGIEELVPNCHEFRRCSCVKSVPKERTPALAIATNTIYNKDCDAVLLDERYMLSSADCALGIDVERENPELTVVLYFTMEEVSVNRIYVHDNHTPETLPRLYDVMLIRLGETLNIDVHVPVCLPHASFLLYNGAPAWIMGPGANPVKVHVKTGRCSFTRKVGFNARTIRVNSDAFICAGGLRTSFCTGRPGDMLVMLVHDWYMLLGLSSNLDVFPMCDDSMGLFSQVEPYREWIRKITNDSSQCQFL